MHKRFEFKLDKKGGKWLSFTFHEQYSQFFTLANWYDYTFIQFSLDHDALFGNLTLDAGLMGFQMSVCLMYTRTREMDKIRETLKQIDEGTLDLSKFD
jgi:hypothetical protein